MIKIHLLRKMEPARLLLMLWAVVVLPGCGLQFSQQPLFTSSGEAEATVSVDKEKPRALSLACWNAQTFFDAVTDGSEYSDFQNTSRWTKDMYIRRLEKLCEVMSLLNADVLVLEEIESEAVVQDIVNRLTDGSWNHKKGWSYACFAKEAGSAIGCAVFSRYELSNLCVHSLDIRVHEEKQPSSRPLMQVTVHAGQKDFQLFVNHWKSKSGGEGETEIWRDWQEAVLAERVYEVLDSESALVLCGDFNRSVEDFIPLCSDYQKEAGANLLLRRACGDSLAVYSPWFKDNGSFATEIGSYYYDDSWERIDNFFFAGKVEVNQFGPVTEPPLADENSIPQGYKIYTDSGCSDHLPLKCSITI